MGSSGYYGLPPYYVQSSDPLTPKLGMSLRGMDPNVAENFVLVDNFAAAPVVTSKGLSFFVPALPNVKLININAQPTSTAIQTLYTCPAGRRAIVMSQTGSWLFSNRHASLTSALTAYVSVSTWVDQDGSAPSIQWWASSALAHGTFTALPAAAAGKGIRVLEAGDSLYCSATNQPYSVWTVAIEFDNTAVVKSVNSPDISLTAAPNVSIYTSPVGGNGSLLFCEPGLMSGGTSEGNIFMAVNMDGSGGNFVIYPMLVPSGGVAGPSFQLAAPVTVSDQGSGSPALLFFLGPTVTPLFMKPGDQIYINSNQGGTANLYVSFNVVEL